MNNEIFCMSEKSAKLLMDMYNEYQPEELILWYSEWLVYEELDAYIKGADKLVLFDNYDVGKRDASVKQLKIFDRTINLQISDATCSACMEQHAKKSSDELSADCEPSGIVISMVISKDEAKLHCYGEIIHHESANKSLSSNQYFTSK